MKIAIFGVGAMGSVYAALMAEAGHDIWAVDIWQDHVDAINASGLRIEGASGDRLVQGIRATTNADEVGDCDLYVLATKASGVGPTARVIANLMGPDSIVITIQNGLGAGERIAHYMATERVLLGVADGFGASMIGPGHVHHNAMNLIRIGEMDGGMSERLERITGIWRGAGFNARAFADIDQLIWGKYICNVAFSGPCTVFDRTLGELMADQASWSIAQGCALEVLALGQARNIAFTFDDPIEYITSFGHKMPDARPSMLLDHHAKRPSEIDAINGMAVELGKQLGVPTPYNEVLTAVIRQREALF
ncbi:MAG: 2-dehydropantoate 2-reductase [Gammaproteobacteria bacterium]|nr:2-dehydropantoate 2-reductase [Gammaproteobacteria bacterium]